MTGRFDAVIKSGPRYEFDQLRNSTVLQPAAISEAHGCLMVIAFIPEYYHRP